jgi:hypothetical protein
MLACILPTGCWGSGRITGYPEVSSNRLEMSVLHRTGHTHRKRLSLPSIRLGMMTREAS